jgi:SAM-dependent methyltransferase
MDKDYYKEYYHLERSHWWFTARLDILEARIQRLLGRKKEARILNAGVATGATTEMLSKYGIVTSLEYDSDCCDFLRTRLGMEVTCGSLTNLPYEDDSFDLVCAFDVIEHIEDDLAALREIRRVLKPKGKYCITVPAYQFLWSEHDEINHHFRRYTKKMLNRRIKEAPLAIDYSGYFNFWLFPPIAGVRLLHRLTSKKNTSEAPKSDFQRMNRQSFADRVFKGIFRSEKRLLNAGLRLPYGISLLTEGHRSD